MNLSLPFEMRGKLVKVARQIVRRVLKYKTLQEQFPEYKFGKGTYGFDLQVHTWGEGSTLQVGAYCSIGARVQIFLGGEHRVDWVTTYPFSEFWEAANNIQGHPRTKGDVKVGNDVWIGAEAVILSGVTIGDGAVIGARAVVAKNVPPYAIAVGNPARIIRKRFDENTIEQLLNIQWWNWEEPQIEKFLPLLLNEDPQAFIQAVSASALEISQDLKFQYVQHQ